MKVKQLTKDISNKRMLETVQTRLFEDENSLNLSEFVLAELQSKREKPLPFDSSLYEIGRIVRKISGDVLRIEAQYALDNNDSLSHSLEQWGKIAILNETKEYPLRRPKVMVERASDAIEYWKVN